MFKSYRIIHFVGIGGIGMSGIAEVLRNLGYEVTGSDMRESDTTRRLRNLGILIRIGHAPENVHGAHLVVVSSAVSSDNPEVLAARDRSIPVIPRAEMLAELGRLKYSVLVAGAHGKTTTTSLIATILGAGGLDPTVVIGGKLKAMGSNARLGQGDFLVAEADESDGSFLKLSPTISVITNIDREHMDYFKDLDRLKAAFLEFANKIPFYGTSIICLENAHTREILPLVKKKVITYGFSPAADLYASGIGSSGTRMSFQVTLRGASLGKFSIPVPGEHNVLNSLAAIAASLELQVPLQAIREGLASFEGIQRRFEFKGEREGVRVFDDYGHHPAEILAVLKAARECFRENRIIVIFQPHRYTRTKDLMEEFCKCFEGIASVFVMDIYGAGEPPIEGVHARVLAEMMARTSKGSVRYESDREALVRSLRSESEPGDVVITLGAGDVYKIGNELLHGN